MKKTLKSALAVLATVAGIVLVAGAALLIYAAVAGPPPGDPQVAMRAVVGVVAVLCLIGAVVLIRLAGKALQHLRVLQIGLGTVLVVGVGVFAWLQQNGAFDRSKVTLSNGVLLLQGRLDPELLTQFRRLLESESLGDVRVRLRSPGGEIHVAMAMGREIHRLNLDVEVNGFCSSSCANYLFTAGRNKYVKSSSQVRFHGGQLQPNILATALDLIAQGKAMTDGRNIPADLDLEQLRKLCGLMPDLPLNQATNILAEKAFFEEIGVSSLTPVYGQYGDYSGWFMDGVHDTYFYEPEDFALFGVTNVIVTGPDEPSPSRPELFLANTSVPGVDALQAQMAEVYREIEAAVPLGAGDIWRSLP